METGPTCPAFLEDDFSAQLYQCNWHVYWCVCMYTYTYTPPPPYIHTYIYTCQYIYTDMHHKPVPFNGIWCQVKVGPTFFLLKKNKLLQALIPIEMFPWFILRREHSPAVLTATQTLQRCARAWEPERKLKNLFSLLQKRNTKSKQTVKAVTNKFDFSGGCSVIYSMAKESRLEACMLL